MNVFVAGATGVIGRSLVRHLIDKGHSVTGMTRDPNHADKLRASGAEAVICDVYDADGLERAVQKAAPQVLVHELTALPDAIDPRRIDEQLRETDRIRVEGTRNLVRAARRAAVRRVVAQSIAFAYAPSGGPIKSESDPLWVDAPHPWARTVGAVAELERQVTEAEGLEGVVLRYGHFYGPDTAFAPDGSVAAAVRKRQFPIGGDGAGVFSFVHVEDAAAATVAAIERGRPGVYNIVDDQPLALHDWLPLFAEAIGAPPPRKIPGFLARLLAGMYGHYMMTRLRGARNGLAKRELGWSPAFATLQAGLR